MKQNAEDGWWQFIELINSMGDKQQLGQILRLLFTHDECDDIAKRVLILQGLLQGKETQRELAKNLNVSIAKITRGSNALKSIDERLRALLTDRLS